MLHVRPQKVFSLLDEPPSERVVSFPIPFQQGTGGCTALESLLLISAIRTVEAKRIFEFGTFFGRATLAMALNMREDGEVFTLSLRDGEVGAVFQTEPNLICARRRVESALPMDYDQHAAREKIKPLKGDSRKMDFRPFYRKMDLVFVDGGHEIVTLISDTDNACLMANTGRPSCIFWHDYGFVQTPGVKAYLDELDKPGIAHIEDTSLCVWFSDQEMAARLASP
jgi:hypothetical protein